MSVCGSFELSISLTGAGKAIITAPRDELEILKTAMRAGTDMDIFISHVHYDDAQKLLESIQSVLRGDITSRLEWVLSKRELLDVVGILGALRVLGIADYYPDLMDGFPPEEELDAFCEHLDTLYNDLRGQLSLIEK